MTTFANKLLVVRQAGVYSLGQLAADRPFLAAAALDHLADMFNDEIEQVICFIEKEFLNFHAYIFFQLIIYLLFCINFCRS